MVKSKTILGYIISVIGIAIVLLTFKPITDSLSIQLPAGITNTSLLIGGCVIIVIGLIFVIKRGKPRKTKQSREVPIYEGNEIIGYRRQ